MKQDIQMRKRRRRGEKEGGIRGERSKVKGRVPQVNSGERWPCMFQGVGE